MKRLPNILTYVKGMIEQKNRELQEYEYQLQLLNQRMRRNQHAQSTDWRLMMELNYYRNQVPAMNQWYEHQRMELAQMNNVVNQLQSVLIGH